MRPVGLVVVVVSVLAGTPVVAGEIPMAYRQVALAHRIPADIFYAIALTESGRNVDQTLKPWPWTLNIHGQGLFFRDRRAAWRAVRTAIAQQQTLVDIGLMQVNWRYHRDRLVDPWRALDPYRNLQVAAEILTDCHERMADWWASVGCYHAPSNPDRARRYRERVRTHWQLLVSP